MKIAIISDVFYPHIGGVEKRYYEIAKRLAKKHSVQVFTMQFPNTKRLEAIDNIKIFRFHRIKNLYFNKKRKVSPAILFSIKLFFKLFRKNFDIIECNSTPYFPCFTCKLISIIKRIPLSITYHESWGNYWYEYLGFLGVFGRIIELLTVKLTKNLIAVSNFTKNLLAQQFKIDIKDIKTIPNGVNLKTINNLRVKKDLNKIIFIGRLNPEKNVDILIHSFSKVVEKFPEKELYILGEGIEYKRLKKITKELDIVDKVKFLRFFEKESDVLKFIKSGAIFVSPSRREGQGIACLEAMAASTPVITAKYPFNAMCNIIKNNQTGIISKANSESISNSIIKIISNKKLYERICQESYSYSKKFDWHIITNKLIKYYFNSINRRSKD
ncbi:MAG: glycosyltransferase [Candidatus Lokiarchaeota archaeon]|nr:glycosyltransferase [Candidatus Lokiarchaeota archaeon]